MAGCSQRRRIRISAIGIAQAGRRIEAMKRPAVLSKVNSIRTNIPNYLPRRRKGRLYQQWVEKAGLSPEAIPREEIPEDITTKKVLKELLRLHILYILVGVSLVILCVGLTLFIMQSY